MRVVVEQVRNADALVPIPSDEVQTVGQALCHFILWPRRLIHICASQVCKNLIFACCVFQIIYALYAIFINVS